MRDNKQIIIDAYWAAGDHFSRLGGSGRYSSFREYHIPALTLILLLLASEEIDVDELQLKSLLPVEIWTCTGDIVSKVTSIISKSENVTMNDISGFIEHINYVYRTHSDELTGWRALIEHLKLDWWDELSI